MRTRRHALAVMTLASAGLLSACASLSATPPTTPHASVTAVPVDTLYYISARARDEGRDVARLADALEYGLVIAARPANRDPRDGRVAFTVVDSIRLDREGFVTALRGRADAMPASQSFAVMYTHGYGTSLHESWEHTNSSRLRAHSEQPWVVFSWPSIGSGVAMPEEGALVTAAYRRDSANAVASRAAYAEALGAVHDAVGGSRAMLVAHSLGGQLVGETLARDAALRRRLVDDPLRVVAFVSPDIDAARFGDALVPTLRSLAQRVLLYASSDDRVLAMSQWMNDSERAGRIVDAPRGPTVRNGLESIDMTDAEYADSRFVHVFGTRHALRRKSGALFDLVHIVGARMDAECRTTLGTAERLPSGAWRLTSDPVPDATAVALCAVNAVAVQQ
jgi:esterase/lipase superfamily enzyme